MLFGEDGSCVSLLWVLLLPSPWTPSTGHSLPCPRPLSSLFQENLPIPNQRLLSLLNSHGALLSLTAFITPFIVLWIIILSLYHFYQIEHLPCVCLGCWGYSGEQMVELSLFPTLNFMPLNQILFSSIQRILHSDSYIEHVQPVFGESEYVIGIRPWVQWFWLKYDFSWFCIHQLPLLLLL